MYKYYEIVKTVFLEEILYKNDSFSDRYQIEVYRNPDNTYSSRLFRADLFDLEVRASRKLIKTTKDFYVQDPFYSILEETKFFNVDDCLNFALLKIEEETKESINNRKDI